jgi:hypothetical protein
MKFGYRNHLGKLANSGRRTAKELEEAPDQSLQDVDQSKHLEWNAQFYRNSRLGVICNTVLFV